MDTFLGSLVQSSCGEESESELAQLCPTLRDPMDCSLSGSSVHGIFQARVLEWIAISFSVGREGRCKQITRAGTRSVSATLGLPPLTACVLSWSTQLRP